MWRASRRHQHRQFRHQQHLDSRNRIVGWRRTTGIYLDDTPIQMRALAFIRMRRCRNPSISTGGDSARPQGTLFGAGSEAARALPHDATEPDPIDLLQPRRGVVHRGGAPSYEPGLPPRPTGRRHLGARLTCGTAGTAVSSISSTRDARHRTGERQLSANHVDSTGSVWAVSDQVKVTPSFYYQDRYHNSQDDYWPLYSSPDNNRFVSADPTRRSNRIGSTYRRSRSRASGFRPVDSNTCTSTVTKRPVTTARSTTWGSTNPKCSILILPGGLYPLLDGTGFTCRRGHQLSLARVDRQ